jgi:hypothetical protein
MVDRRIKPHYEQLAEQRTQEVQRFAFRRNQAIGLVLLAALVCLVWLLRTNPAWIFPAGWWRP